MTDVAAAQPPVQNYANIAAPPLTSTFTARDRRYDLLRGLWGVSSLPRVRKCRRVPLGTDVGVVHSEDRGAGFSGLCTCGSVWGCPYCAAKILARRSLELGVALTEWQARGGTAVFITLTMRHHAGHRLAVELEALNRAMRRLAGSRVFRKWSDRLGSPGSIKVVEITHGRNGWHPHIHLVLLVDGSTSAADVAEFTSWLFPKWHREVVAAGMPGALAVGQDAHLVTGSAAAAQLAEYLTVRKAPAPEALGREMFGALSKSARSEHSTSPYWLLVDRFFSTGDAAVLGLMQEYEQATFGRKQVRWSPGLRGLLGVGQEVTDQEAAEDGAGDPLVLIITAEGWKTVLRLPEPSSRVLAALDEGGPAGLRRYLDTHHIEYREAR